MFFYIFHQINKLITDSKLSNGARNVRTIIYGGICYILLHAYLNKTNGPLHKYKEYVYYLLVLDILVMAVVYKTYYGRTILKELTKYEEDVFDEKTHKYTTKNETIKNIPIEITSNPTEISTIKQNSSDGSKSKNIFVVKNNKLKEGRLSGLNNFNDFYDTLRQDTVIESNTKTEDKKHKKQKISSTEKKSDKDNDKNSKKADENKNTIDNKNIPNVDDIKNAESATNINNITGDKNKDDKVDKSHKTDNNKTNSEINVDRNIKKDARIINQDFINDVNNSLQ